MDKDQQDPFWGEYGMNMHIPNMSLWVWDMKVLYYVACIRSDLK